MNNEMESFFARFDEWMCVCVVFVFLWFIFICLSFVVFTRRLHYVYKSVLVLALLLHAIIGSKYFVLCERLAMQEKISDVHGFS